MPEMRAYEHVQIRKALRMQTLRRNGGVSMIILVILLVLAPIAAAFYLLFEPFNQLWEHYNEPVGWEEPSAEEKRRWKDHDNKRPGN